MGFRWVGPLLLASLMVALASLVLAYPSSLWAGDDYSLEYLAAVCNAGARLNDLAFYRTGTMGYHPAVAFYVFSWLAAFAALGRGALGSDLTFFDRLIENAPLLFASFKICGILMTGLLVLAWRRCAARLAPAGVLLVALALYFVVTPQSVFRSVNPLTETFALAVNALFVLALVRLAQDPLRIWPYALCGIATAFAYLLKVSFLYVWGALLAAFAYLALFGVRPLGVASVLRLLRGLLVFHIVSIGLIYAVGLTVIGPFYFAALRRLHWAIFTHGPGSEANASLADVLQSITISWDSGATALPVVMVVASSLLLAVAIATLRRQMSPFAGAVAVGAAMAALASVAAVLTRYSETYVVGVAATVPLLFVAAWYAAGDRRARRLVVAIAVGVVLLSAWRAAPAIDDLFAAKVSASSKAAADAQAIAGIAGSDATLLYLYRAPMVGFGKGYVAYHCEVPHINDALLLADRNEQSSMARSVKEPNFVVVDKIYSSTEAEVRSGKNLDPINAVKTVWHDGDELIALDKVWLIRRARSPGG